MMMMMTVLIIAMMIMMIKCEEKQLKKNSMPKQIDGKEKILDIVVACANQLNVRSGILYCSLCLYST